MTRGYIELEEVWIFTPVVEGDPLNKILTLRQDELEHQIQEGRILEFDPEFLKEYEEVKEKFFKLNTILGERFDQWRKDVI